jgi:phenylalanine-4-hydroxylase
MVDYMNERLENLPPHLKKFMVPQHYESYTPVNHAVWRYVMRQNLSYLSEVAHEAYLEGLAKTGITLERIPSVKEMNDILGQIGWAACTVDGFIHPQAFMEFQEHKVLVIAADIRQIDHIEYTPAPDIIHEAAGHAPIIADEHYAEYLRLFGEIGRKAFSTAKDYELFEAIRHLSIIKEDPYTAPEAIHAGEKKIEQLAADLGEPSEMSLIRRLHWWTVEYGLIGNMENPKIYGAGLLSSIGESVSCMKPDVKKIPYSLEAMHVDFDITKPQPQLFVTPDFKFLSVVLEQFADTMALRRGGSYGLKLAKESGSQATVVYSSGLAASGMLNDYILDDSENPAYLSFAGPVSLSDNHTQLPGHDTGYHREGFGSPCGNWKNTAKNPELLSEQELQDLDMKVGRKAVIEFRSGVTVSGILTGETRDLDGRLMLLSFSDCSVTYGDRVLFQPEWGIYDMAVGAVIVSVYSGVADPYHHVMEFKVSAETTHKIEYDSQTRNLFDLYGRVRRIRETRSGYEQLTEIAEVLATEFPLDWLCTMEILEILSDIGLYTDLRGALHRRLEEMTERIPACKKLIEDGFRLANRTV